MIARTRRVNGVQRIEITPGGTMNIDKFNRFVESDMFLIIIAAIAGAGIVMMLLW